MPLSKRSSRAAKRSGHSPTVAAAIAEPTPAKKSKSTPNGKTYGKKKDKNKSDHVVKKDAPEWAVEELETLINKMKSSLPKTDSLRYNTAARRFDWAQVEFGTRSRKDCSLKWDEITKRLRRYRTMTELVTDAEEWVKRPWSSHSNPKKHKHHPDLPKKPLTPYFRYFLEKRQKYGKIHPKMSMTDLAKIIAAKFNEMSAKKKAKYQEIYNKECVEYKERLENFKLEHPGYAELGGKDRKSRVDCIEKPQTPFQLFRTDRLNKIGEVDSVTKAEALEKIKKHWSILSEAKRVKWIRKAVLDEARYFTELEEYCATHPEYKPPTLKSSITKFERDLKDKFDGKPDKPPNSGYSLYSKIMLKELSELPSKDKMAEISRRWKNLTDSERKSYNKQSMELNDAYKQQYENYLSTLSEAEREKLMSKTTKKKPADQGNKEFDSGAPVTQGIPRDSALQFFQSEMLAEYEVKYPAMSKTELIKLIGNDFELLSSKKKEKYEKMASDAASKVKKASRIKKKSALFKDEPKRPPSNAYSLFSAEMLRELTMIEPRKRMFEISKRWKEVSPKEKERYKERTVELLDKYKRDYAKFIKTLSPSDYEAFESSKTSKKEPKKGSQDAKDEDDNQSSSSLDSSDDGDSTSSSSGSDSSNNGKYSSSDDSSSDSDSDDDSSDSGSDSDSDISSSDNNQEKKKW